MNSTEKTKLIVDFAEEMKAEHIETLDVHAKTSVADYFVGILFPGEGAANLPFYRKSAMDFLNSDDNGVNNAGTQFVNQANNGTTYDTRVRGMVSMLMTLQRFQEQ